MQPIDPFGKRPKMPLFFKLWFAFVALVMTVILVYMGIAGYTALKFFQSAPFKVTQTYEVQKK